MRNSAKALTVSLLVLVLVACERTPASPKPTEPPLLPTETLLTTATPIPFKVPTEDVPTITPSAVGVTTDEACYMIPNTEIIAYQRPSLEAEVFDVIPEGNEFIVEGRTADGWIGFNPDVPQAPNVGVFRHRWVPESSDFRLEGACEDIPLVEGPPAGVCFAMVMDEVPVYTEPDTSSGIVATLEREDFVEVRRLIADYWLMVDLSVGSVGISQTGWMESIWSQLNGSCYALATELPPGPPIARLNPGYPVTITFIQMITEKDGWAIGRGADPEDHILRTTDGAETWIDVTPPEFASNEAVLEKHAIGVFLTEDICRITYFFNFAYFAAQRLSFWSTDDGGASWTSGGATEPFPYLDYPGPAVFADPDHGWLLFPVFIGMGHNGFILFQTTDGGHSYEIIQSVPDTESLCSKLEMVFIDTRAGWMTNFCPFQTENVFLDTTVDGGLTWEQHALDLPTQIQELEPISYLCHTHSPTLFSKIHGKLVVECSITENEDKEYRQFLYTTEDGGETWRIDPLPDAEFRYYSWDKYHWAKSMVHFINPQQGWLLGRDIYWTEDGGSTWAKIKDVNWDGQFSFVDASYGWAVARADDEIALVRTTDGGRHWQMLEPQIASEERAVIYEPCKLTVSSEVTAYDRPNLEAEIFATMPLDMSFYVEARTEDGWIGFDPAYAQAGNIGVFHHRWVQETNDIVLEGDCSDIPIVVGPPPGVCLTMPFGYIPIYAEPDTSSKVVIILQPEDFVEVVGKTEDNWILVNLSVGNLEIAGTGWIVDDHVSLIGPCMDLPIITP
jgi:photosystem II stability/assembly factor-like uncharacterized protein